MKRPATLLLALAALLAALPASGQQAPADLIFHGGKLWTVDEARPVAEAVAIRGNRIIRVGDDRDVLALRGPATRVIDLDGRLMLPGFIDGHTHFENATDWFFEVAVTGAESVDVIYDELRAAVQRVPKGMWITSGSFATFGRAAGRGEPAALFMPDLDVVDAIAPDHPVLLKRFDGAHFVNSKAFELMRMTPHVESPRGGEYVRDPTTGRLTGVVLGTARHRIEESMPPRSRASRLIGARAVVQEMNRHGITTIHDIARVDEISQRQIFHTHVERSSTDVGIFTALKDRGELTVRLRPLLSLPAWHDLASLGFTPGSGDDLIRYYGGLKAFVDGYLMFEGRADRPEDRGRFTFRFVDEETMERDIVQSSAAGFIPGVHVVGDRAIHLLLDWYEKAIRENSLTDPRFRIIHMFYPTASDIQRAGRLRLAADVTPDHFLRDYRTIDDELGPERAANAHAYGSMLRAGIRLNIVSDWPGSFYKESGIAPLNPLENIYLVVTRQDTSGWPEGGWHPQERLTVEQAIRAVTLTPAETTFEEDRLGSIMEGKLADLVVLSRDILSIPPRELLETEVVYTVFDGKLIYER
jgi:predicted amidohydrolase YtcJ